MESLALTIYIISIVSSIGSFLGVVAFILLLVVPISLLVANEYSKGYDANKVVVKRAIRISKLATCGFFMSLVLAALIPSERTAYTMLAASSVNELVQTAEVKQVGDKSIQVLNAYLDSFLEEHEAPKSE